MPSKPSPNSLIHCAVCGEDYSATYKRCPFCGAKNAPSAPQPPVRRREPEPEAPPPPRPAPEDPDDTYVFDGQDLFDEEPEEDCRPARPKGGKRLAEKPSSNPFADAQINWPRMITFLCSLVIIIAALVIVFTVIYPQLRGSRDPVASATEQPSAGVTDPAPGVTQPPAGPGETDPAPGVTQPPVDPALTDPPLAGPGDDEPTGLTLSAADVTLYPVENGRPVALRNYFQLKATVTPADWNGTVTFESSDPSLATVSADGTVSHANPAVTRLHQVVITARAGTLEAECIVRIAPKPAATQPPAQTDPPAADTQAPDQTDPPVDPTQAPPSGGGNVTVGRRGTVVNAEGGLRVRSGPGTTYAVLATVWNNTPINVVADAGGGWYEITYAGTGGAATTGYIMGQYISTN